VLDYPGGWRAYEPADQHPFLTGTAVSMRNIIFLASIYERSRHKE
jgi:hypothetical protein